MMLRGDLAFGGRVTSKSRHQNRIPYYNRHGKSKRVRGEMGGSRQ